MSKTKPVERNVRVTIECTAHEISNSGVIRLDLDTSHNDAYPVLLDTTLPNVTVEDMAPERVWTDGDVIQTPVHTYARHGGIWHAAGNGEYQFTDGEMAASVGAWPEGVLRYQAGEQ